MHCLLRKLRRIAWLKRWRFRHWSWPVKDWFLEVSRTDYRGFTIYVFGSDYTRSGLQFVAHGIVTRHVADTAGARIVDMTFWKRSPKGLRCQAWQHVDEIKGSIDRWYERPYTP